MLKIKMSLASVGYPQGNGQAEASNKTIFNNVKKNLEEKKGRWLEELPKVLWAQRTTKRSSTGESPYAMVFGTEAVIPTEIGLPTLRSTVAEDEEENNQQLSRNLDLLEETRKAAQIRQAKYQLLAQGYYSKRISPRSFKPRDWVLGKNPSNQTKFQPNWEGPYEVIEALDKGSYTLKEIGSGKILPRTWSAYNLKKYYI